MGIRRHYLGSAFNAFPGSETAFGLLDREKSSSVRALAHVMLAVSARTREEARAAVASASAAGLQVEQWAPWAVLKGSRPVMDVLAEHAIKWETLVYQERPLLDWVACEDRPVAARALLAAGVSPQTHIPGWPGEPSWLEHACAERGFAVAHALLDAGAGQGVGAQDRLDRALLAVARSRGLHGHSAQYRDPERWKLWRRLVRDGANPARQWTPSGDDAPSPAAAIRSWLPAAAPHVREQWTTTDVPVRTETAIHEVVFYVASRMAVHNPDAALAWKALDQTIDWASVPADGWGVGIRASVLSSNHLDRMSVADLLTKRGVVDAPQWPAAQVYLLSTVVKGFSRSWLSNDCPGIQGWSRWVAREVSLGRPMELSCETVSAFARITFPTKSDLMRSIRDDVNRRIVPAQVLLEASVGAWEREMETWVLPRLPPGERESWRKHWGPVFVAVNDLRTEVARERMQASLADPDRLLPWVDACVLAATLPAEAEASRPRMRL